MKINKASYYLNYNLEDFLKEEGTLEHIEELAEKYDFFMELKDFADKCTEQSRHLPKLKL